MNKTKLFRALQMRRLKTTLAMSLFSILVNKLPAEPPPQWTDSPAATHHLGWFTIGPVVRGGMKIKIRGSSYTQTLGIHATPEPLADPPGIGDPNAYGDRIYDNGYVMKDSSQGGGLSPNTTWNWGYNAKSTLDQYDPAAGTLSFSKQGEPGYVPTQNALLSETDRLLGTGIDMAIGVPVVQNGSCSLHLAFGFQGIWGAPRQFQQTSYAEEIRRQGVTDRYDVAGITSAAFTDLNHRGKYDGPFDPDATPPYTVIPNLPMRERQVANLNWTAQNEVSIDVDLSSYQLSFRPTLRFAAGNRLILNFVPKVGMHIVDASVDRKETFTQSRGGVSTPLRLWSDKAAKTKMAFAAGISGGADVPLGKAWFGGIFAGYEWVPEKTKINIGPNTITLDTAAWATGLVLQRRF